MATFAIVLTSAPHQNKTATAIDFIESTLKAEHTIAGVFLYQDGVLHANVNTQMPSDELQSIKQLKSLKAAYDLPLHLCITAGEKRGLTDEDANNIDSDFVVSGLGEMVELTNNAEYVVQF